MSPNPTDFELGVKLTKLEQSIENLQESYKRVSGSIDVFRQSASTSSFFDISTRVRLESKVDALLKEQAEFGFIGRISRWWNRSHWRELEQRMSALEAKQKMDTTELNAKLDGINADLDEASTELQAEIKSLRELVENGGMPSATLAKIDAIAARAKAMADIIKPEAPPVDPAPAV